MRQNDGSEFLGPGDPRRLGIGIIHVSFNDNRQSVITAITTQSKLGRDQIVLELPAFNRSFKSAVDFEGLHQMTSGLEAALVLIAPDKSKIANLARNEHLTVYSSLEELAAAEYPPPLIRATEVQAPINEPINATAQARNGNGRLPAHEPAGTPASETAAKADRMVYFPLEIPSAPMLTPQSQEVADALQSDALPEGASHPADTEAVVSEEPGKANAQAVESGRVEVQTIGSAMPASSAALIPAHPGHFMRYEPLEPPRRSRRQRLFVGIAILLLVCLGLLFYRPVLDQFFPPNATVTIVPLSQHLQHSYQIMAVLGQPDASKRQVDARALYADSQTQSETVKATGHGQIVGQPAVGVLTFYNTSTSKQTIAAGTVIFAHTGVAVVNDDTITLPALDPALGVSSTTDAAHTIAVGSAQNIPASTFDNQLCCGGSIYVSNTQAFTGGQDAQSFTYVQQSDIDGVSQTLSASLIQQATMSLQDQIRPNEKLVGALQCEPHITSDHQAGERVSEVTVSVRRSCVGEVYNLQAVQALVAHNLTQDSSASSNPAYVPVGNILTQIVQATPDSRGNVTLNVNATGMWVYQFTDAQRQHFASLVSGKDSQDAKNILLSQTGVRAVMITLTGVGETSLPGNTSHITINIEAVQGLHV